MHPRFRDLVSAAADRGAHVIDRANLTAFLMPEQRGLPAFLAERGVEIIASLPYYLAGPTDAQRGVGVFDRSLEALAALNALGYGVEGSGLELNLIANPVGAFLPPDQASLECDWRGELDRRYGVRFNRLYTLTNLPVGRYLESLQDSGDLEDYVHLLARSFNPATLPGLMCRNTISVGWDGALYDCDFNQMLEIDLALPGADPPPRIFGLELEQLGGRSIAVGTHCFGCTAGAGASCGGSPGLSVASAPGASTSSTISSAALRQSTTSASRSSRGLAIWCSACGGTKKKSPLCATCSCRSPSPWRMISGPCRTYIAVSQLTCVCGVLCIPGGMRCRVMKTCDEPLSSSETPNWMPIPERCSDQGNSAPWLMRISVFMRVRSRRAGPMAGAPAPGCVDAVSHDRGRRCRAGP